MKGIIMALAVTAALFLAACTAQNAVSAPTESDSAPEASAAAETMPEASAEEESVAEVTTAEVSALGTFWTEDSTAAQTLSAYVAAATDADSETYIPEEDRIAVFDLDGTLMCETYPWRFEYMVFADYVLTGPGGDAEAQATVQEILDSAWGEKPENMSTRQAAAGARSYAGITPEELTDYVKAFRSSDAEGFSGMTRGEAWYQPMLEAVSFLQENGFTVYVVTATERNIVRGIIDGVLRIPPSHVIGAEYGYTATGQGDTADGSYTFQESDKVVFDGSYAGENAKMCKVDAIVREIGQQPALAFGNSSGDLAMLQYVITGNQYPSASFIVLADDDVREYGDPASAVEKRAEYEAAGLTCISMRDDFATIYGENVTKAPVQ